MSRALPQLGSLGEKRAVCITVLTGSWIRAFSSLNKSKNGETSDQSSLYPKVHYYAFSLLQRYPMTVAGRKKQNASNISLVRLNFNGLSNTGSFSSENLPLLWKRPIDSSFSCHKFLNHKSKASFSAVGISTSTACLSGEVSGIFEGSVSDKSPIGTSSTLNRRRCIWTAGGATPSKNMDLRV